MLCSNPSHTATCLSTDYGTRPTRWYGVWPVSSTYLDRTYLDRPGESHGSTNASRCDKPYALSLSTTVATRARRDTCDLLMCLLFLNSAPLARGHLRPYCHTPPLTLPLQLAHARVPAATSPHVATAGTTQHTHTRRQLPPLHMIIAALAPCTGLASLRSLRTHRGAAAIALPSLAERMQLSFLPWTFVLCPSLAGTLFFSFLRHASLRQLARTLFAARLATPARTRTPRAHGRRPATNDATCGPPDWLTGKLQQGGTRSVRSPPTPPPPPPLLATPIATPLQGGRSERPVLLFLKLPKWHVYQK